MFWSSLHAGNEHTEINDELREALELEQATADLEDGAAHLEHYTQVLGIVCTRFTHSDLFLSQKLVWKRW